MKSQSAIAAKVADAAGYVRSDDLAKKLGTTAVTVTKWCRTGAIPGMRIGAVWWAHAASATEKATRSTRVGVNTHKVHAAKSATTPVMVSLDVVETMIRAIVAEAVAEIRTMIEG